MLVLFETPAGYAIFKLLDEKKLQKTENLYHDFETPEKASEVLQLKHFKKFKDTTEALEAATATVEGKMSKSLKKMLKKLFVDETQQQLLVADDKLGRSIKEKLNLSCVTNTNVHELMRCIRSQASSLLGDIPEKEMTAFSLGLAHSLSRYKLKFSPDKVDTMIVQAISLLDDLDKELNNYVMRCKEWYGWHFPELGKIITDNLAYAKTVKLMGDRKNCSSSDFSKILPEEVEKELKEACEISMGTEVSEIDITNIRFLCDQVIEIHEYRAQLYDYLKNRMMAIAPNLTVLVGELVGARLIAHAGSLMNLAKHPSSTVQILGAEKALFRALKTKHDTPKYGLIYHASLIGSTNSKNKGKASRMLAAKTSLGTRVDALGEDVTAELGIEHKATLEARLKMLEEGFTRRISGTGKSKAKWEKYENKSEVKTYNADMDSTLPSLGKKRKIEEVEDSSGKTPKKVKIEELPDGGGEASQSEKKKKKKKKRDSEAMQTGAEASPQEESSPPEKKKKKKKSLGGGDDAQTSESTTDPEPPTSEKKKKKKKHSMGGGDEANVPLETTMESEEAPTSEKKKKKKKKSKESASD